jgi:hypothetical protein
MTYAPQFMVSIVSGGEYQEPKPTENPFAATLLAEFPWLEQEPSDTGEEDCQVSGADTIEALQFLYDRLKVGSTGPAAPSVEDSFKAEQLKTLEAKCDCGSHLYGIVRVHHCNEGKPRQ